MNQAIKIPVTKEQFYAIHEAFCSSYDIIPAEAARKNDEMKLEREIKATLRKDGRYVARYYDDKHKMRDVYGKTAAEAIRKAYLLEGESVEYTRKFARNNSPYSYKACFARWLKFKCKSAKNGNIRFSTVDKLETTYNRYFRGKDFERLDTRKMTEKDIVDVLEEIIDENGGVTYKQWSSMFNIVSAPLIYMKDEMLLERKSYPDFEWNTIKRKVSQECNCHIEPEKAIPVSENELDLLINAIKNSTRPRFAARLGILLDINLGLRRGELASITWENIDWENREVRIGHSEAMYMERNDDGSRIGTVYRISDTKTKRSVRSLPLTNEAIVILHSIRAYQIDKGYYRDDQFIIYDGFDYKYRSRELAYELKMLCREAGIREIPIHLLRKSLATRLAQKNVPVTMIRDLLGHTDCKTTETYYILKSNAKDLRKIMDNIA